MKAHSITSRSSLGLDKARAKTRGRILIVTMKKIEKIDALIENLREGIEETKSRLKISEYKRKRLMQQNFSPAPHLKKTHTKYWKKVRHLHEELEEKYIKLESLVKQQERLKRVVPTLRDQILEMVHRQTAHV